ncbi:putative tail-fiber protein [Vibrio phage vB_VchM-138]|uniref:tail fiber assembly n=1 Tax=Vibrio phage vB_VchM-138 TaxID=1127518 RepID=UPI0002536E2C|nr:tail fiber assembly [Vibrio phage vB_VchM-138]AFC22742.1 putative tail-fiber protein [Vibrio phage vB_VchM-138]
MGNPENLLPKFFAFEDALMFEYVEGAIEITEEQYNDAIAAKMAGRQAFVRNGELVIFSGIMRTIWNTSNKSTNEIDEFDIIPVGYTDIEPLNPSDVWDGSEWLPNVEAQFEQEIAALNTKHNKDVLEATNQYNIAVARDGSTEGEKVIAARANLADIDAQFELDQLAIINKYYGE